MSRVYYGHIRFLAVGHRKMVGNKGSLINSGKIMVNGDSRYSETSL